VALYLIIALTCLGIILTSAKIYDAQISRGTLIGDEGVEIRTAPSETAVVLTKLPSGLEVEIKNVQDLWVQVVYPGSFSGWTKNQNVLFLRNK
jgi:uncharacterized protein YgiM (DUF1202 family)